MGAHPMENPSSTARLVYDALGSGKTMTQQQICQRIGRTQGAVCKAVWLLIGEGYAKPAGALRTRHGPGRLQLLFAGTGKAWLPSEAQPAGFDVSLLVAAVHRIVRVGGCR